MRTLMLAVSGIVACGPRVGPGTPDPDALVPFVDLNPDPDVVEVELVAEVAEWSIDGGPPSEVWAYRDAAGGGPATIPGPLLEVEPGQRMLVHFINELPMSTTVHFHGMRKPNAMDGTPATQLVVMPGDHFDYEFVVEDPGLFWYHPHVMTADQVAAGLYGPVRSGDTLGVEVDADRVLVLDDVRLVDGAIALEATEEELRSGRQGDVLLVNGRVPDEELRVGTRERWRILDAANARHFALTLAGASFTVIGGDSGPVAAPYPVDVLRLAPGDRLDVIVELPPGIRSSLRAEPVDRGFGLEPEPARTLLEVQVTPELQSRSPLPEALPALPLVGDPGGEPLQLVLSGGAAPDGSPVFYVNDEVWPFADAIPVALGDRERWEVVNQTDGSQPLHLHGLFYEVLDVDGVPPVHRGLEDTFPIPAGSTANLAVHYRAPGVWMFHSHLLEHGELGLMGALAVE